MTHLTEPILFFYGLAASARWVLFYNLMFSPTSRPKTSIILIKSIVLHVFLQLDTFDVSTVRHRQQKSHKSHNGTLVLYYILSLNSPDAGAYGPGAGAG